MEYCHLMILYRRFDSEPELFGIIELGWPVGFALRYDVLSHGLGR